MHSSMPEIACCAYLRKSREDEESERRGKGETLARHRRIIESLASERDETIAEWYPEVVSGETIAGRPQMKRLLSDIASGNWDCVYVIEASRLGRGGGSDQEKIVNAFKYTDTKLVTEYKVYDPVSEADMRQLKNELRSSEDELSSITARLSRGKRQAAKEGVWLATGRTPYGWKAVRVRGNWQLEPDENHGNMLRIYDMLEDGCGIMTIADAYNAEGIPTSRGGKHWTASSVRAIALNIANCGYISYGKGRTTRVFDPETFEVRKVADRSGYGHLLDVFDPSTGHVDTERCRNNGFVQISRGLHYGNGCVDERRWYSIVGNIIRNAPVHRRKTLANPLSGILVCGKCGYSMTWRTANGGRHYYTHKAARQMTRECDGCHSARAESVFAALVEALSSIAHEAEYATQRDNSPNLREEHARAVQKAIEQETAVRRRIMDAYEAGAYDVHELKERLAEVDSRIASAQRSLADYAPTIYSPETVVTVKRCISLLEDSQLTPQQKNEAMKRLIRTIEYRNDTPPGKHGDNGIKLTVNLR